MVEIDPDIASAVRDLLKDDANVAAMVDDRIQPVEVDQGEATPYIAYMQEDDDSATTQDGAASFTKSGFVIWSVGANYAEAKRLANHVRVRLAGYRGTVGVHTIAGIFAANKSDVPIPPRSGEERAESEIAARYNVSWYQSPATIGAD